MKQISDVRDYTNPNGNGFVLINYDDDTQKFEYSNGDFICAKIITYENGIKDSYKHSLVGPAVSYSYKKEWWIEGNKLNCSSQEEFEKLLKLKAFW